MNNSNILELPLPSNQPHIQSGITMHPQNFCLKSLRDVYLVTHLSDAKLVTSTSDAKLSHFKFSPGAPVFFQKELTSEDAIEGDDITLRCEVSKPGVRVEWRKGGMVLQPGKKYQMRQKGCVQELCIQNLEPEDSGYYTCDAGDQLTTASLAVKGSLSSILLRLSSMVHFLVFWYDIMLSFKLA